MKKMVSAQLTGELAERYEEGEPGEEDDQKKSEYLRELLEEALSYRDATIYEQLSLSDNVVKVLEADRREGESRELVVRRGLNEVVEYRQGDALDTLDASEELRTQVEDVQKEDESMEAVLRRLIREGAEASTITTQRRNKAKGWAERSIILFLALGVGLAVADGLLSTPFPIVPVTGEGVFAGALFFSIIIYFVNLILAEIARYRMDN